ncbi:hypothetical protein L195_g027718 [Trifolium pratense]|uniref:Uncharacterized protein n=1 Tax=Trifolium pratense TaxID=57577 RepID=A0A2K3KZX4_TRIPR|nr:hypothetical protein L195_g027718 [Trifolium pratense]
MAAERVNMRILRGENGKNVSREFAICGSLRAIKNVEFKVKKLEKFKFFALCLGSDEATVELIEEDIKEHETIKMLRYESLKRLIVFVLAERH